MKELGELIRAAREQRGITLEQASAETRIRRSYLDAMEDGDVRILPGAAYATGFLRNYTAYLGLNPDEILMTYHAIVAPRAISIAPATTVGMERMRRRSRRRIAWTFATALAVICCGLLIYRYNTPSQSAAKPPQNPFTTTAGYSPSTSRHSGGDVGDQAPHGFTHSDAVIKVKALETVWVHIKANGHFVYWGPIAAGTSRMWHGHDLKLATHRGPALKVWVDGTRAWHVSHITGRVVLVAHSDYRWHRVR